MPRRVRREHHPGRPDPHLGLPRRRQPALDPHRRGELRVYGDRCLDVNGNGTANGTKITIWTCNGGANQRFTFNANGSIAGVGSGKCVDVNANGTANGTVVQLWECNGTGAQTWSAR
ncbi:RICIN domain-containing protein [Dactylosporangium cerinum]